MFFISRAVFPYVDRGDHDANDYTIATLTADSAWHDLNLSGVIGVGRRLVCLNVLIQASTSSESFKVRTKGYINTKNIEEIKADVAGDDYSRHLWVYTDKNGVIEYYITSGTYLFVNIVICAWIKL